MVDSLLKLIHKLEPGEALIFAHNNASYRVWRNYVGSDFNILKVGCGRRTAFKFESEFFEDFMELTDLLEIAEIHGN